MSGLVHQDPTGVGSRVRSLLRNEAVDASLSRRIVFRRLKEGHKTV